MNHPRSRFTRQTSVRAVLILALLFILFLLTRAVSPAETSSTPTIQPLQSASWPTAGWPPLAPEAAGLDAQKLAALDTYIQTDVPHLYSLLIVRHGSLVFERYYQGYYEDIPFEVASITKSITSALVGIALDKGYLSSLDQKVLDFFPEYAPTRPDTKLGEVTLRHLLTMSAGFNWSEDGNWLWPRSSSWAQFALRMTIINPPGALFTYNTPAAHLLSGVLTKAAGRSTAELAQEWLFDPLGIPQPDWLTDPEGYTAGAHGLYLRARDLAKFGYLYLQHGQWDGQQLIPAAWIDESTRPHLTGAFPQYTDYGYLWWVTTEGQYPAYFAAGYGGQYLEIIPDLDLIVVITSNMEGLHTENRQLIGEWILPAVQS